MEDKKTSVREWNLRRHINQQQLKQLLPKLPKLPKTVKETYREQVTYDYNMDKL